MQGVRVAVQPCLHPSWAELGAVVSCRVDSPGSLRRSLQEAELRACSGRAGGIRRGWWRPARSGWPGAGAGAGTAGQGWAVPLGRDITAALGGSRSLS